MQKIHPLFFTIGMLVIIALFSVNTNTLVGKAVEHGRPEGCLDPDNGITPEIASTVTTSLNVGTELYSDHCAEDGKLVEYFCQDNGWPAYKVADCAEFGFALCIEGACTYS